MSADSRPRISEAHALEPRASEAPASKAPVHATAAHADALAAASAANVTIRTLSHGEFAQAAAVMVTVWGEPSPMSPALLTALDHAGSYVAGAFSKGRMIGVTSGFFGAPAQASMHSHVAAVIPGTAGRGIGTAMKLHQRAWCLDRDATRMTWTFDPLIARNAAFNVRRLGARLTEYKVDFYGPMNDGINAGQGSDRIVVTWALDEPLPSAPREPSAEAPVILQPGRTGEPERLDPPAGASAAILRVPGDVEAVRASDPALAIMWRRALRETMLERWEAGWRPVAVARDGSYYMEAS